MKTPRQRRLQGSPLLSAGTGMSVVIIGCSGEVDPAPEMSVSGNLVAPPMLELCVEVYPEDASEKATVTVNSEALPQHRAALHLRLRGHSQPRGTRFGLRGLQ